MTETKEILVQVQDIGRRLEGINTDLSASEALIEAETCTDELNALTGLLGMLMLAEHDDHPGPDPS